jgi:hypothetical protein
VIDFFGDLCHHTRNRNVYESMLYYQDFGHLTLTYWIPRHECINPGKYFVLVAFLIPQQSGCNAYARVSVGDVLIRWLVFESVQRDVGLQERIRDFTLTADICRVVRKYQ